MANWRKRAAGVALSLGLLVSQSSVITLANDAKSDNDALTQAPVKVRATHEEGTQPQSASDQVLSGRITSNVENLSKEVLHDEIKLQRFNLAFRANAAKQGRWKGWRYFVSQEGNLALTEGGVITTVTERGEHLHTRHSTHNNKYKLAFGGTLPSAIGQCLAGAGSALEFGINEWHAIDAENKGYGSKQARNTAIKLVADIDAKLADRDRLIKEQPVADKEIAEMQNLEGSVLRDFRDLGVAEFERYHASAKKTLAQQNSFYVLDVGKNVTGAISSFLIMHSQIKVLRNYNFTGGLLSLISGFLIATDPIFSRMVGKAVENADKKSMIAHGLEQVWEDQGKLEKDFSKFRNFCVNHQVKDRPELAALIGRMDAYDANHAYYVFEIERNSSELRRGNRTAVQNMGVGALVGSTKMAGGIMTLHAGHSYIHDGNRTNTNLFVANVVYLPAVTYALLDNIRIQTQREFRQQHLKAKGELPGQLIKARSKQLDSVEQKI